MHVAFSVYEIHTLHGYQETSDLNVSSQSSVKLMILGSIFTLHIILSSLESEQLI